MILFLNGDSHTAAGEAVNDYCFAEDDPNYFYAGRVPHPDNLEVSFGTKISKLTKMKMVCEAESASSNARIIRTTREFLGRKHNDEPFVLIGWSTWEREEWMSSDGKFWQVNAGGIGEDWPQEIKDFYKPWVVNVDMQKKMREANDEIYQFHLELKEKGIKHLFFNTYEPLVTSTHHDFGDNYIGPYSKELSYFFWLKEQGYVPTKSDGYHYGPEAHTAWAKFLMPYLTKVI